VPAPSREEFGFDGEFAAEVIAWQALRKEVEKDLLDLDAVGVDGGRVGEEGQLGQD
jgi:hypothetical protein